MAFIDDFDSFVHFLDFISFIKWSLQDCFTKKLRERNHPSLQLLLMAVSEVIPHGAIDREVKRECEIHAEFEEKKRIFRIKTFLYLCDRRQKTRIKVNAAKATKFFDEINLLKSHFKGEQEQSEKEKIKEKQEIKTYKLESSEENFYLLSRPWYSFETI